MTLFRDRIVRSHGALWCVACGKKASACFRYRSRMADEVTYFTACPDHEPLGFPSEEVPTDCAEALMAAEEVLSS